MRWLRRELMLGWGLLLLGQKLLRLVRRCYGGGSRLVRFRVVGRRGARGAGVLNAWFKLHFVHRISGLVDYMLDLRWQFVDVTGGQ